MPSEDDEAKWSFDEQADYARSGASRIELAAACTVVAIWVGLSFHNAGAGYAIRTLAFHLLPLACIWKPEVLGRVGLRMNPFLKMDQATPERMVRFAGWAWLFLPLLVAGMAKLIRWSAW